MKKKWPLAYGEIGTIDLVGTVGDPPMLIDIGIENQDIVIGDRDGGSMILINRNEARALVDALNEAHALSVSAIGKPVLA